MAVCPPGGYPINFTLVDALEVILPHAAVSSYSGPRCDLCDDEEEGAKEEDSRAEVRCITCNHWLCAFHQTSHKRSRDTKQHVLKGVSDIQADPSLYREVPKCEKHPLQPLDLFCLDCDVPICGRCSLLAPHQKHDREEIQTNFATFREQMRPMLDEAQRVADACVQGVERVEQTMAIVQAHKAAEEQRAHEYFAQLRALLDQRKESVCQELHLVAAERIKALEHQAGALRFDYAYASSICEESQGLLQQGDDVRVLKMKNQIRQQVQQVAAKFDPRRVVPCRCVDFRFEEHKDIASVIAAAGGIVPDEEEKKDGDAQQDGEEKAPDGRQSGAGEEAPVSFDGSAEAFLGLAKGERLSVNKLKITGGISAEQMQRIAEVIQQSSSMTHVYLDKNNIAAAGASALADALKVSCSVTTVGLGENQIGDAGAIALADALKESSSMASVDLSSNNIGADGARALAELRKHRPALEISV